jgi:hypothetical protein
MGPFFFKIFLGAIDNEFRKQEVYFSRLMRVYIGLLMLAMGTYARFPCFLLVSRVRDISSGIGPCFPLAGALSKLYANDGGK